MASRTMGSSRTERARQHGIATGDGRAVAGAVRHGDGTTAARRGQRCVYRTALPFELECGERNDRVETASLAQRRRVGPGLLSRTSA